MIVEDLISKLLDYNQKADITLVDSEDITISYICKDEDDNELSPKESPQLFIVGVDLCPSCVNEYIDDNERMCSFYGKPCRMVGECFEYEDFYE